MVKGKGRKSQNWLVGTVWLARGWAVHGESQPLDKGKKENSAEQTGKIAACFLRCL